MPINQEAYKKIVQELSLRNITLVAVSKTKPVSDVLELYGLGHRDFGENYVQEMVEKQQQLPTDIRWHFIGHLQSNKVRHIASFVYLIHGIDSAKLLKEVSKQAAKHNRIINCLLQVHIAKEETKFGMNEEELNALMNQLKDGARNHARVIGLMGMASFIDDMQIVSAEFHYLKSLYDKYFHPGKYQVHTSDPGHPAPEFFLSMGMSADYKIAIEEGSNMVRIGSMIFGERT